MSKSIKSKSLSISQTLRCSQENTYPPYC